MLKTTSYVHQELFGNICFHIYVGAYHTAVFIYFITWLKTREHLRATCLG